MWLWVGSQQPHQGLRTPENPVVPWPQPHVPAGPCHPRPSSGEPGCSRELWGGGLGGEEGAGSQINGSRS